MWVLFCSVSSSIECFFIDLFRWFVFFFGLWQVHIVYMGERQHEEPELVQDSHHDILSNILGRFQFELLFVSVLIFHLVKFVLFVYVSKHSYVKGEEI